MIDNDLQSLIGFIYLLLIQVNNLQKELAVQMQKYERLKNSIEDFQTKNNNDILLEQKLKCTQHALQCKN